MLLCAYFAYQAFEIYSSKDKWASQFYSNYGSFESWWNKQFKRTIPKEFAYTLPDQKLLYPYKAKAALLFGYCCAFGSLLLWSGEKWASLILMIPDAAYALVIHGPMEGKTQTVFGRAEQAWVVDFAIVFVLFAITGAQLSIASEKKKQVAEQRAF
uniref:Uncharacterized protein n=1 Tax=Favella ehrenbergii TaxID=182087 RepID=A0A7S3MNW6_9SPIT|mmetsp:Transcript_24650/g.30732  ORF Transcript_24650/g.30732 Transcript_24650/m.30732 type:complete len:156 (+) Transcript_24650:183-650(+)